MNDINENEFTCDICRDLIPLVKDGVASADSGAAVRRHIKSCTECAAIFEEKPAPELPENPENSPNKVLRRVKQWLTLMYSVILLFGLYFALSLSGSDDVGITILIMPFAGIFAYLAFRWKALCILPVIIFLMQALINETGNLKGGRFIEFDRLLLFTAVYYLLALAGIVIMALLKFAFGKTNLTNSKEGENDER